MRRKLLVPLAVSLLFLGPAYAEKSGHAYGQEAYRRQNATSRLCADVPGQTSGTHRFLRVGEAIEISLRGDIDGGEGVVGGAPGGSAGCEPVALDLQWSNGRNNGSNFDVTFLDGNHRPISTKMFWAFLSGNLQLDLSSLESRPVYGSSMTVSSVPTSVTIQAVQPFAAPASLSYTVTRVARAAKARGRGEEGNRGKGEQPTVEGERGQQHSQGNEVVSIRNVVRLIGASKLPVVQIELRTAHPFPIKDTPLQLRIGKKVFVEELGGEYTGRRLTLSLTPEMFAELQDGDEIVASFGKQDGEASDQNVWDFGKLVKKQTANSKQ